MPSLEQIEKTNIELRDLLDWYRQLDVDGLRRPELGQLSFDAGLVYFSRGVDLYRALTDCDLTNVSNAKLTSVVQSAIALKAILESVTSFDVNQQNPSGTRQQIIQQAIDQWERDFDTVTPVLAYATKSSADFQRLEREARGTLTELSQSKNQFQEMTSGIVTQMRSALGEVQDAAKEAGISQHASYFNDEASSSKKLAIFWLSSSVIIGLITIAYVAFHIEPTLTNLTDLSVAKLLQAAIPRLLIIFVLTFMMIWAAKNFNSSVHNYVVNRHRRNALASFQAFVEGASSPEIKDTVLVQATSAIFAPQDSGYSKIDLPTLPSQVVEVFKGSVKS